MEVMVLQAPPQHPPTAGSKAKGWVNGWGQLASRLHLNTCPRPEVRLRVGSMGGVNWPQHLPTDGSKAKGWVDGWSQLASTSATIILRGPASADGSKQVD